MKTIHCSVKEIVHEICALKQGSSTPDELQEQTLNVWKWMLWVYL